MLARVLITQIAAEAIPVVETLEVATVAGATNSGHASTA
jgi:hypothetical protein